MPPVVNIYPSPPNANYVGPRVLPNGFVAVNAGPTDFTNMMTGWIPNVLPYILQQNQTATPPPSPPVRVAAQAPRAQASRTQTQAPRATSTQAPRTQTKTQAAPLPLPLAPSHTVTATTQANTSPLFTTAVMESLRRALADSETQAVVPSDNTTDPFLSAVGFGFDLPEVQGSTPPPINGVIPLQRGTTSTASTTPNPSIRAPIAITPPMPEIAQPIYTPEQIAAVPGYTPPPTYRANAGVVSQPVIDPTTAEIIAAAENGEIPLTDVGEAQPNLSNILSNVSDTASSILMSGVPFVARGLNGRITNLGPGPDPMVGPGYMPEGTTPITGNVRVPVTTPDLTAIASDAGVVPSQPRTFPVPPEYPTGPVIPAYDDTTLRGRINHFLNESNLRHRDHPNITRAANNIANTVTGAVTDAGRALGNTVGRVANAGRNLLNNLPGQVVNAGRTAGRALGAAARNVGSALRGASPIRAATSGMRGMASNLSNMINSRLFGAAGLGAIPLSIIANQIEEQSSGIITPYADPSAEYIHQLLLSDELQDPGTTPERRLQIQNYFNALTPVN